MPDPSHDWVPDLEAAIDRSPLQVSPSLPLVEAIVLLSQTHHLAHSLSAELGLAQASSIDSPLQDNTLSLPDSDPVKRASCLLVVENQKLVGILTERDVVRFTAQALNLADKTVAEVMVHPVITLPYASIHDIFAALFLFRRYRIRHLPVVDDQDHLVGVISHTDVRQILRPANLLRFHRVSDVMTTEVIQAPHTATLLYLTQLMAQHRVSCIVITQPNEDGITCPVGIVTERDIVQFQAFQLDLQQTQAFLVMSTPLFLLRPEDSLWTAHQEMQKRRVGRLVVSWNWGQGLGIVTQTSLLRIFDPIEMYRMIENLQQTVAETTAQQPASESPFSAPSPDAAPALPLHFQTESIPPANSQLPQVHRKIHHLLHHPDLAVEQRQAMLQSVLETLEHLDPTCRPDYSASCDRNNAIQ
ncbi:MAG: CBS domain-containing protein [Oculatellaceae cyanobacterium Prado106]|jgi:CBS domain-containing protein|nr:CBS domain-containing protein [Oculatellaceae cyanobacterium Prado106]